MEQKAPNDRSNSEEKENGKNEEFERFENAVRRIMKQSPDEAKRIRKEESKKKPNGS